MVNYRIGSIEVRRTSRVRALLRARLRFNESSYGESSLLKNICAQIVPEGVGCGDSSDSVECGINNLRDLNTWLGFDPPPGTI